MNPEQFAYWLQGYVELNGGKMPTEAQWKSIKEHLAEVFVKVTPPVDPPPTKTPGRKAAKVVEKIPPQVAKDLKEFLEKQKLVRVARDPFQRIC